MNEEAKELFDKLINQVDGVTLQWTSSSSFKITDLLNNEIKDYQIKEV